MTTRWSEIKRQRQAQGVVEDFGGGQAQDRSLDQQVVVGYETPATPVRGSVSRASRGRGWRARVTFSDGARYEVSFQAREAAEAALAALLASDDPRRLIMARCGRCGDGIAQRRGGATWCKSCAAVVATAREAARRAEQAVVHRCVGCGTTIRIGGVGRPPRWCSGRCARARSYRERPCATCGVSLAGTHRLLFCSSACAAEAARREPLPPRSCSICATSFTPRTTRQIYCAPACKHTADRVARNRGVSRRRFPRVRYSLRLAIFKRDGWRCGICHAVIDRALKFPHPGSWSLDHIDPDGPHEPSNWQASHLACNVAKGRAAA